MEDSGSRIRARIESEGHVYYMEKGRRPNKQQNSQTGPVSGEDLEQWVKDKGIDVQPLRSSLEDCREGIQVPNRYNPGDVVTEVITDEWFDKLIEKLSTWHIQVVQSEVSKIFNGNSFI